MPEVSLHWVDDGEPFFLRKLPLNAKKEIVGVRLRNAKAESARHNAGILLLMAHVHAAVQVRDKKGTEAAKGSWDGFIDAQGPTLAHLKWPLDSFDAGLDALYEEKVLEPLGATRENVDEKLQEKAKEVREVQEKALDAIQRYGDEMVLTQLYWHIRSSDAKTVGGVPFSRANDDKEDMMAVIADHASEDDLQAIAEAFSLPEEDRRAKDEDLDMSTPEVVEGKARNASGSSRPSSGASTPSSERHTETTSA